MRSQMNNMNWRHTTTTNMNKESVNQSQEHYVKINDTKMLHTTFNTIKWLCVCVTVKRWLCVWSTSNISFNPPWDSWSWWSIIVNTRANPWGCSYTLLLSDTHLRKCNITRIRCTTLLMHICTYCSFVWQLMEGLGAKSQTSFLLFYQQNTSLSSYLPQCKKSDDQEWHGLKTFCLD